WRPFFANRTVQYSCVSDCSTSLRYTGESSATRIFSSGEKRSILLPRFSFAASFEPATEPLSRARSREAHEPRACYDPWALSSGLRMARSTVCEEYGFCRQTALPQACDSVVNSTIYPVAKITKRSGL